jgi:hypothetical protein
VNNTTFLAFLEDIRAWNALAPDVILNIRTKMYKKARYIVFVHRLYIWTDTLFSVAAKVDTLAPMKNHVAGEVKDKLLKELEGRTGETDSEDSDSEDVLDEVGGGEEVVDASA